MFHPKNNFVRFSCFGVCAIFFLLGNTKTQRPQQQQQKKSKHQEERREEKKEREREGERRRDLKRMDQLAPILKDEPEFPGVFFFFFLFSYYYYCCCCVPFFLCFLFVLPFFV